MGFYRSANSATGQRINHSVRQCVKYVNGKATIGTSLTTTGKRFELEYHCCASYSVECIVHQVPNWKLR
jgi:hypothetical protein